MWKLRRLRLPMGLIPSELPLEGASRKPNPGWGMALEMRVPISSTIGTEDGTAPEAGRALESWFVLPSVSGQLNPET